MIQLHTQPGNMDPAGGPTPAVKRLGILQAMQPLTKLALLLSLTINVFLITHYRALLPVCAAVLLLLISSRVHLGLLKWLPALAFTSLPLLTLVFALAGYEQTGRWDAGLRWGVYHAGLFFLRLQVTVVFNILVVRTTTLREFSAAFRRVGVPEPAVLFLTTIVRFIPLCLSECLRIIQIQRCRGLRRRSLFWPSGFLPVLVPLFLSQVQRSHDLALSLEIRHFGWSARNPLERRCVSMLDLGGWLGAGGMFLVPML